MTNSYVFPSAVKRRADMFEKLAIICFADPEIGEFLKKSLEKNPGTGKYDFYPVLTKKIHDQIAMCAKAIIDSADKFAEGINHE